MCDGWTGPTKLSIINFMVYCKGSTIFLKFIDASENIKDNKCLSIICNKLYNICFSNFLYSLLKDVIKEVGEANIIQLVTNDG